MVRTFFCTLVLSIGVVGSIRADDWPQWFGPQRDGIWREEAILDKFPAGGVKPIWKMPLGAGYSGPAVANGFVYVMDRQGAKPIEGNPAKGTSGDGQERVVCLNAKTGVQAWAHAYDCVYKKISYGFGPRTTPTIVGDRVYALGTMGDLRCLDTKDGKLIWSKNFVTDFNAPIPIWGWSSNPLVDGDKIICLVGGEKQAVVAFNRKTGEKLWSALTTSEIGYAPPMIFEIGGKRQLIIWHSESVNSLNPDTGEKYWGEKYPRDVQASRPAAPIATPRLAGDVLFVASYYHGPFALKLDMKEPKASVLWRAPSDDSNKVKGQRCLIATPAIKDGHIYGIDRSGELRCCELGTGKELWNTLDHQDGKSTQYGTTFIIPHKERFFLFTDAGNLIIVDLSAKGYREISRAKVIEPTQGNSGRDVVWCHPAFANKCIFVRNDKEIVCVSLAG
jgi:outer membrane protein assembly factor BamB